MSETLKDSQDVQQTIQALLELLKQRQPASTELLDIIDVLGQVQKKVATGKNPAALVNRLVNYIRSLAVKARLHFSKPEEDLIVQLSVFGQKAGLNGQYMADFSDKSQFYGLLEEVPRH
ncbi:bacteriocin immunity protein [Lactiplantibacillus daowaiensis]|uniref:Bacteriocin immunity protein n=1 Tax=Lactiplantibacillus daowaiensis TaxID=2559918 RepID=A0ABW1S0D7_9LACO|nr:bacteriocin immunity protein [Lactiplantibacillus daowaiensis]